MVLDNFWINPTSQLNFSIFKDLTRKGLAILEGLRSGKFSDFILRLQALLRGVNEAEILTDKYGSAAIAAQIRQLAQEIRELAVSRPVTVVNGNPAASGSYDSYLVTAVALGAALGAMGYCYMWWKGLSVSSVMFVTKHNMEKAVATVSNHLEQVIELMSAIKRELTIKLENLNRKAEQQKETNTRIANDINEVNLKLSQIRSDFQLIHQKLSGLAGMLDLLLRKQDVTNTGLEYLCLEAGGIKYGHNARRFQDAIDIVNQSAITYLDTTHKDASDIVNHSAFTYLDTKLKGLPIIAETKDSGVNGKSVITRGKMIATNFPGEKYNSQVIFS